VYEKVIGSAWDRIEPRFIVVKLTATAKGHTRRRRGPGGPHPGRSGFGAILQDFSSAFSEAKVPARRPWSIVRPSGISYERSHDYIEIAGSGDGLGGISQGDGKAS